MRTFVKVATGSGTFLLASTAIYWLVSGERAGTVLLLGTAIAAFVMAGYAAAKIRGSVEPVEDRGDADPGEGADEPIVSFTKDSPWPLVFGIGVAILAGGLVFGPALAVVGAIVMIGGAVGLVRESIA